MSLTLEEARVRRGKLTVFFGAAPGVGKTFAMLEAARAEKAEGREVVVGVVETHGRRETADLLEGLEVLPRRSIPYRGVTLEELDLDAALLRKPGLLLVDDSTVRVALAGWTASGVSWSWPEVSNWPINTARPNPAIRAKDSLTRSWV